MVGQPVAIGPFFGGMNTVHDPSTLEDEQAAWIENFDIDTDGSIVSRPCLGMSFVGVTGAYLLGPYTFEGQTYMLIRHITHSGTQPKVSAVDLANRHLTSPPLQYITGNSSSVKYTAGIQYDDKFWIINNGAGMSTAAMGYWTPSGGWVTVAGIPQGVATVIYKERMFIANPSGRVYFSKIADPTVWTTGSDQGGFFDVGAGDGDEITNMIVHMGQIIIFKKRSTYVFSYDSAPDRGSVQQVSGTIGTAGKDSVVTHEGIIYTFHDNKLYAINNWRWIDVSAKITITDAPWPGVTDINYYDESALSVIGRRILVRYRNKYFVYYPELDSWVTWVWEQDAYYDYDPDFFVQLPVIRDDGYAEYWAGRYKTEELSLFKLVDGLTTDINFVEKFTSRVVSKMYDYELPYSFKRLHWWGIDVKSRSKIDAKVYPETYNTPMTWNEMESLGITWDQAGVENRTWARPGDIAIDVSDSYSMGYATGLRTFVKFIKSLRFRKATFEISHFYEPNQITMTLVEPFRFFSASAFISAKQIVPRKGN